MISRSARRKANAEPNAVEKMNREIAVITEAENDRRAEQYAAEKARFKRETRMYQEQCQASAAAAAAASGGSTSKPTIAKHAQLSTMRRLYDEAEADRDEIKQAYAECPAHYKGSGADEGGGSSSMAAGGSPKVAKLPPFRPPPGATMTEADLRRHVAAMVAFYDTHNYHIIGREYLTTDLQIVNGRVLADLQILNYAVNDECSMLNKGGTALCPSMQPFTIMQGTLGTLQKSARLVIVDMQPVAMKGDAGSKGLLDTELMAEVRARPACICFDIILTLALSVLP